ncbi:hypothetical protein CDV50_16585 [Haematobacter massiliensis]|uniref:Membrane protein n=1 Tax=Haematobacter massiliensis TaxID=195105 RepID=A0A086YA11_9RHOB|nr:trimeric intracellular cation channel family protein [Haematobacter massiliensis]KFI31111.1 membrane protein [Haematobacter massiliensis]OWJ69716.1 hypothetical protein CDV50_16585 [Haematobacter massiliensis]OWJ88704.1 hypothetical protein CDV51_00275 [Haematobacter massiliensis]QBJ23193.1 trimeric intracellular cation channel family protein [Haematobacter massiliensis]
MGFGVWLDAASVFVFALTGALAASRAQLDPIGFLFLACLTAVGGGTVRDVLLQRDPVFWIGRPGMLLVAAVAATLVFFLAPRLESRARAILWCDAVALAIAVPAGVNIAAGMGQPWSICIIMGVITGCLGGLMRDVVSNEVPMVLRQGELYVTAAAGGALAVSLCLGLSESGPTAALIGGIVTFGLRAGSLIFGWRLPSYKPRPPRR